MAKSTNIAITLKSGIEAQVSIIRKQGYTQIAHNLDGCSYETSEYSDSADIKVTIAKAGINNEYAHLEGTMLCTTRKVGNKIQIVKAQLTDDDAKTIAALASEILAPEDKAAYDAKVAEARKAEVEYEQGRRMMSKVMGY